MWLPNELRLVSKFPRWVQHWRRCRKPGWMDGWLVDDVVGKMGKLCRKWLETSKNHDFLGSFDWRKSSSLVLYELYTSFSPWVLCSDLQTWKKFSWDAFFRVSKAWSLSRFHPAFGCPRAIHRYKWSDMGIAPFWMAENAWVCLGWNFTTWTL